MGESDSADPNLELSPRTDRTYSSRTMRLEYQIGPGLASISVTGFPSFRPDRGTNTKGSHWPLSHPFMTPFVISSLIAFGWAPMASAISLVGHVSTPYSSESCMSDMISIQTPRASQEQRLRLALLRQS